MKHLKKPKGWKHEPYRHGLASKGIKTTSNNTLDKIKSEIEFKDKCNFEFKPNSEYEEGLFNLMSLYGKLSEYKKIYDSWPDEVKKHFLPTTGIHTDLFAKPEYHRDKKNIDFDIVLMSPQKYKQRVLEGFEKEDEPSTWNTAIFDDRLQELRHIVEDGERFPMLSLDYHTIYNQDGEIIQQFTQEGRHRAELMMEMGVSQVPVMIIYDHEGDNHA